MPSIASQITVKNARFHDGLSRETCCYSCDVYLAGKHLSHVRNDGGGGADFWEHVPGSSPRQRQEVSRELALAAGLYEPDLLILSMAGGMTFEESLAVIGEVLP